MTLPLDAYIGFAQTSFTSNDKLWAALALNKTGRDEGKYDFKAESFDIPATAMTGVIDGDNYWLIATLSSGACNKGGIFEFKSWVAKTPEKAGYFNRTASEALSLEWQKAGCNVAINVNNIPVLKVFVKVLSELKIIVSNESKAITVRLNIEEEACSDIEISLAEFWAWCLCNDVDTLDEKTPQYAHAIKLSEAGIMSLPVLTNEALPGVPQKSLTGKITGHKVECFPFKGELPCYEEVDVVLPKKEEKKGDGRSYGGRSIDPKAVLEARVKFYVSEMAKCDESITDIKGAFTSTKASKEYSEYSELLLKVMGQ